MVEPMNMPELPWPGGCQCGHIRYLVKAQPLALLACHCQQCQKLSASAFSLSMSLPPGALKIDWEKLSVFQRGGHQDSMLDCHYCGQCGNRIVHTFQLEPDLLVLKPGHLDDTGWLRPAAHIWTRHKQPWVQIPQGALQFDAQPDSDEMIHEAWARQIGRSSR